MLLMCIHAAFWNGGGSKSFGFCYQKKIMQVTKFLVKQCTKFAASFTDAGNV